MSKGRIVGFVADALSPVSLGYDLTSSDGIERGKDGMPTAIRLFKAGVNETTQGDFLFDELSARAIIADAKARGIDYAFDLEHLSIDKDSPSYDPDARGWFRLELRGRRALGGRHQAGRPMVCAA
jgi:hypothetical protein